VVTALYRRYRPDSFAELIGQEQVTGPLMAALRNNRVNHAYLFSGPRGCGKTTSARILARCLNCAEGPTDTPCGKCSSCRELATGGQGSLDVIEIDAASHGGVDDARELRERAVFAPARDRYKIFIIDEAHMVTSGGFNALLKLVEEPPEHVKFIFATTEPEKVIGTIRSRTHHYPFRLIPPATMLPYVEKILGQERMEAEPGVLPLVVRAGGGSVRDTLSVLDQLIAGTDSGPLRYDTTIGLLGYTPGHVLGDIMAALADQDAPALFSAVDKVVQGGQDPRRFAEDLLQRLRDAAVAGLTGSAAGELLHGLSPDEVETLQREGRQLGPGRLDHAAQVVDQALNSMGGTTNPRTHIELMCARLLLPEAGQGLAQAGARLDRLERRLEISPRAPLPATASPTGPADRRPQQAVAPVQAVAAAVPSSDTAPDSAPGTVAPPETTAAVPAGSSAPTSQEKPANSAEPADGAAPSAGAREAEAPASADQTKPAAPAQPAASTASPTPLTQPPTPAGELTAETVAAAWPQVVSAAARRNRVAWMVIREIRVAGLRDGDVLVLQFDNATDEQTFRGNGAPSKSVEVLRESVEEVLGVRPRFVAHSAQPPRAGQPAQPQIASPAPNPASAGTAVPRPAQSATSPATPRPQPQRAESPRQTAPSPAARPPAGQASEIKPAPAQSPAPAAATSRPTSTPPAPEHPEPLPPEPTDGAWPEESIAADWGVPDEPLESSSDHTGAASQSLDAAGAQNAASSISRPGRTPASRPESAPADARHHPKYGEAVIREVLGAKPIEKNE
jgi:DNA polymerase-3 subunit gamma/tau